MPEYSKTDVSETINKKDAVALVEGARNYRDKCLISLMFCIPVRPKELLELKKKDFLLYKDLETREGERIEFEIVTKKLRGKFQPKRVFTIFRYDVPFVFFKSIWVHVRSLRGLDSLVFDISDRRIRQVVDNLGVRVIGRHLCPYAFRHSVLTRFAQEGKGIADLMYFKGSSDIRSISPYLHGKKQRVKIE